MKANDIDRWLLNHIFDRNRVFKIAIRNCYCEYAGWFGRELGHFLTRALEAGPNEAAMRDVLREHYSAHTIQSFNETIGSDINHPYGDKYFLPWESDRVRPLNKFLLSHKIGPTPETRLPIILGRLIGVVNSIKKNGFKQVWRKAGYIRLIRIVDIDNKELYMVRDGNHRLAGLSFLKFTHAMAGLETRHWENSVPFRFVARITGRKSPSIVADPTVRESEVEEWPHVRSGVVTPDDAIKFFRAKFSEAFKEDTQ